MIEYDYSLFRTPVEANNIKSFKCASDSGIKLSVTLIVEIVDEKYSKEHIQESKK